MHFFQQFIQHKKSHVAAANDIVLTQGQRKENQIYTSESEILKRFEGR